MVCNEFVLCVLQRAEVSRVIDIRALVISYFQIVPSKSDTKIVWNIFIIRLESCSIQGLEEVNVTEKNAVKHFMPFNLQHFMKTSFIFI